MDDVTGVDKKTSGSTPANGSSAGSRPPRIQLTRSDELHHRRRRGLALIGLALLAFLIGLIAGAGGGSSTKAHPAAEIQQPGFFKRVQSLAGSGNGSLAVAERSAEDAAITRTLAYTPYIRVAGAQHKEIALTFDDGPGPYTPKVLAVLQRTHTPGTFFEVGVLEQYFHVSTSQIVADGYPIGDHTQTHAPMSQLSSADQQTQLLQQTSAIGAYGAPFPRMFRPPYGYWNRTTLKLLRRYRMLMVLWTVDTSDYRLPGVGSIVHAALSGAQPGAIILMHDGGGDRAETVAALPLVIKGLRARGYKLVSVPRLVLDNPPPANQGYGAIAGSGG